MSSPIQLSPEVEEALAAGVAVVALETAIVTHGLPAPHNLQVAAGAAEAVRRGGAIPATVAVMDGRIKIGLETADLERLAAGGALKVSSRDLGPALARGVMGGTTVAATMRAASMAGIGFMATGGIGGVHRGRPQDESADLAELARSAVAVFCAGPKIVLDLERTLERLDTLSVPVIGYRCNDVPAFYLASSGIAVGVRADDADEVASILAAAWATGSNGALVVIPPPRELQGAEDFVRQAAAEAVDVSGPDLTPLLLARIAELSQGRSLDINVELVINNAAVAARSAAAYARLGVT